MAKTTEEEMEAYLKAKKNRISKAKQIKMLMKMQKGLFGSKMKMTDFREPVLFLVRRNGDIEFYDDVKQGKFIYKHSSGETRWMEIRPQDQMKFNYLDRKVRCYIGNEDRPFTGFDNPAIDTESLVVAVNRVSATKQKYEESLAKLKTQGMKTWMYVALAIAGAIAIIIFALGTWGGPIFEALAKSGGEAATQVVAGGTPTPNEAIPIIK